MLESGGGYAVPLFAMVAIVLAAVRHFRWLMLPAVGAGLIVVLQLAVVLTNVDDARSDIVAGSPIDGLGELAAGSVGLGGGWLLIFGGVGLLVASSIAGWKR